jgi:hypothetical protein
MVEILRGEILFKIFCVIFIIITAYLSNKSFRIYKYSNPIEKRLKENIFRKRTNFILFIIILLIVIVLAYRLIIGVYFEYVFLIFSFFLIIFDIADSINKIDVLNSISIGSATYDDNKIRIEQNELVGTLDIKTRAERSQFDKAPLDSNKLGVYFSPQTMIDEDIIAQFGFTSLDEYIGDPGVTDAKSYPQLIQAAQSYWKKYENRNNINAYINMFTLFDLSFFRQLDQLLPARTDKITGLLIKPNILERSKDFEKKHKAV